MIEDRNNRNDIRNTTEKGEGFTYTFGLPQGLDHRIRENPRSKKERRRINNCGSNPLKRKIIEQKNRRTEEQMNR